MIYISYNNFDTSISKIRCSLPIEIASYTANMISTGELYIIKNMVDYRATLFSVAPKTTIVFFIL